LIANLRAIELIIGMQNADNRWNSVSQRENFIPFPEKSFLTGRKYLTFRIF